MVSIQIWVTQFHTPCTGELEQVCLALVIGCPFLSTGLGKQHHIQLATTRDAFVHSLPPRNDTSKLHAANVVQVSQDSPRGPRDLLQARSNRGRRRVRALGRIGNSVSRPCCCSTQMKTTSFTSSVFWLPRP